jgi:hypothetical protein
MKFILIIIFCFASLTFFSQKKIVEYEYISEVIFTDKGKVKRNFAYTRYDKKGNEIEWGFYGEVTGFALEGGGIGDSWDYSKLDCVAFYTYDKLNRKILEKTYSYKNNNKEKLRSFTNFTYDSLSNLILEEQFESDSTRSNIKCYYYDKRNNNILILDSTFYFANNPVVYIRIKIFDSKNRIIKLSSSNESKLIYREKYIYNETQDLTTILRYNNDSDSSLRSIRKIYYGYIDYFPYSNEKLQDFWIDIDGKSETREFYKYNRKGLLKLIYEYNGLDKVKYTKFKYKFYK